MIGAGHNFDHLSDSDDEYFAKEVNGMKVNVYFTRNGNIIGKREVRIPKNGFYPTGKLDNSAHLTYLFYNNSTLIFSWDDEFSRKSQS